MCERIAAAGPRQSGERGQAGLFLLSGRIARLNNMVLWIGGISFFYPRAAL
jgi:hypothetical protein